MTTTNSSITNNSTLRGDANPGIVLSVPGYMTLRDSDFLIDYKRVIGKGGFATIHLGALRSDIAARFGFRDVAVKIYKSTFGWFSLMCSWNS